MCGACDVLCGVHCVVFVRDVMWCCVLYGVVRGVLCVLYGVAWCVLWSFAARCAVCGWWSTCKCLLVSRGVCVCGRAVWSLCVYGLWVVWWWVAVASIALQSLLLVVHHFHKCFIGNCAHCRSYCAKVTDPIILLGLQVGLVVKSMFLRKPCFVFQVWT